MPEKKAATKPAAKPTDKPARAPEAPVKGTKTGVVETDQRDKTRKVVVSYMAKHPKYGKYVRKRTMLHVHEATNETGIGDRVEVAECRPISRTKRWTVIRVVEKAPARTEMVFEADDGKKKKVSATR